MFRCRSQVFRYLGGTESSEAVAPVMIFRELAHPRIKQVRILRFSPPECIVAILGSGWRRFRDDEREAEGDTRSAVCQRGPEARMSRGEWGVRGSQLR